MDKMLHHAFEIDPRGVYLARRALLRSTQVIEMMADDREEAREEAIAFARRGLELDPTNALVVATAAKITINFEGKLRGGTELARRAVELGPSSPLAWESIATAHAQAGDATRAHAAALRARDFASSLPQTYLWDMVCCMTATVAGRYDEAIGFGERARDLAPTFKAPLRYLAALFYARGDTDAARENLRALKALEPNFALELLENEHYPVAGLRRTRLIALARSKLL
jgi:tetratricopeptide (TPR) repeat protein